MQGQAEINSLNTFGGLTAIQSSDLLQLPTELLFRIISYLTQSTIPSLMVCRALRPLCEELLYKSIFLPTGTNRSRRLLETFLLRPDLADLVQHLFIDLSWAEDLIRKQGLTNLGQLNPLYPLSLARNLRSFAPSEVDFWIWSPDMVAFREAVFNMRLVKLEIPTIRDPRIGYTHTQAIRWDGDLGDEFRKLFQKQPLLQELILPRRLATMTVNSLMTKLQLSDIPNLKSLHADPVAALAFLPVIATKLENLTFLASGDWNDQLFSRLQTASKAVGPCLLRFSIMAWYQSRDRRWVWDNLDKVFGLFPNVETLCVTIASLTTVQDMPHAGYYFTKVAEKIRILPCLRSLDVTFQTLYPKTPGIFDVATETVAGLKAQCPLLQSVIDPQRRLWTFASPCQDTSELRPHLVGQLIEMDQDYLEDLPDA